MSTPKPTPIPDEELKRLVSLRPCAALDAFKSVGLEDIAAELLRTRAALRHLIRFNASAKALEAARAVLPEENT